MHFKYPKVSNWVQRIKDLASKGRWQEVISCHLQMKEAKLPCPDSSFFPPILKASAFISFRLAKAIHADILKLGLDSFTLIANSILDFYSKCGSLSCALDAFDHMTNRDSISWNIIVHCHLQQAAFHQGLSLFFRAKVANFIPNISSLVLVVHACCQVRCFSDGAIIHSYIIRSGLLAESSVQNSLLSMYTELEIKFAQKMFDEMLDRDVITWSVMIGCHLQHDQPDVSLRLFCRMVCEYNVEADGKVAVTVLKACTQSGNIEMGNLLHGFVTRRGLGCDLFVGNSLLDFYSKYGDSECAFKAFHDMPVTNVVSWNSLLHGLVQNEKYAEVILLFDTMQTAGVQVDERTLVTMLQVCKSLVNVSQGKSIHAKVIRKGYELNKIVGNCLIDAYAKCKCFSLAWKVFGQIKQRDEVTWSTMIAGFTHCGMPDEAISVFQDMNQMEVKPNAITFLNLIEACSLLAELKTSKWAHAVAIRHGLACEVSVGTAILHMYSKCGAIEASRKAFEQITEKNIMSWSAMIAAYGKNGLPHDALALHAKMKSEGMKPNLVTILSALCACSHGGLVEEGLALFKDLVQEYGGEGVSEHYSCVVDLLARAGWLESAFDFLRVLPGGLKSEASAWGALLSACRRFSSGAVGPITVSRVLALEPSSSAGYLQASSLYAVSDSWSNAARMRRLVNERKMKVIAGHSVVTR